MWPEMMRALLRSVVELLYGCIVPNVHQQCTLAGQWVTFQPMPLQSCIARSRLQLLETC